MTATIILGIVIAALFGNALRIIYKSFFKGEAACCDSGGGCSGCTNCQMKNADYKKRVEKACCKLEKDNNLKIV